MKIIVLILAILACAYSYEFAKPKNGKELEETLRSELDDIWVIEWYQNQKAPAGKRALQAPAPAPAPAPAGGQPAAPAKKPEEIAAINDLNANVLTMIQKQCPSLNKEYKFVQANLDPEL